MSRSERISQRRKASRVARGPEPSEVLEAEVVPTAPRLGNAAVGADGHLQSDRPLSQPGSSPPRGQKRASQTVSLDNAKKKTKSVVAGSEASTLVSSAVASTGGRSYNLRRTTARKKTSAAITPAPATVARQIRFEAAANEPETSLPDGIVNIYDARQLPAVKPFCACPSDKSLMDGTFLAFAHIATYGDEYGESLKAKETAQMEALRKLLPGGVLASLPSNSSDFESMEDSNDDDSRLDTPGGGDDSKSRNQPRVLYSGLPTALGSPAQTMLPRQPLLNARMRTVLVNWLIEVFTEYKVSSDTFHLAVSIMDKILLKGPTPEEMESSGDDSDDESRWFLVPRSNFQALGCACAWIASKFEEKSPPAVDDFVYISDHSFTTNKLRSLEERICQELEFRLDLVTPVQFVTTFLRASHACPCRSCQFDHPVLRSVVMYLLELSRLSHDLSFCKPSLLAAAAVYLGRATVGLRSQDPNHAVHPLGIWTKTLQHYTGYSIEDLKDTVLTIHRYQLVAESTDNLRAAYFKYKSEDYHCASRRTALRVENLGFETDLKHDAMDFTGDITRPSG